MAGSLGRQLIQLFGSFIYGTDVFGSLPMASARLHGPESALLRGLLSLAVWSLYAVALFTPAMSGHEGGHHGCGCTPDFTAFGTLPGWATLLLGWVPPFCLPWSANFLLLVGWVLLLCGRYRAALRLGVAAALAGLTTLCLWAWGVPGTLLGGYLYWQASLLLFALGAWALWWKYSAGARRGFARAESDSLKPALQRRATRVRTGGAFPSAGDDPWDREAAVILLGNSVELVGSCTFRDK